MTSQAAEAIKTGIKWFDDRNAGQAGALIVIHGPPASGKTSLIGMIESSLAPALRLSCTQGPKAPVAETRAVASAIRDLAKSRGTFAMFELVKRMQSTLHLADVVLETRARSIGKNGVMGIAYEVRFIKNRLGPVSPDWIEFLTSLKRG